MSIREAASRLPSEPRRPRPWSRASRADATSRSPGARTLRSIKPRRTGSPAGGANKHATRAATGPFHCAPLPPPTFALIVLVQLRENALSPVDEPRLRLACELGLTVDRPAIVTPVDACLMSALRVLAPPRTARPSPWRPGAVRTRRVRRRRRGTSESACRFVPRISGTCCSCSARPVPARATRGPDLRRADGRRRRRVDQDPTGRRHIDAHSHGPAAFVDACGPGSSQHRS